MPTLHRFFFLLLCISFSIPCFAQQITDKSVSQQKMEAPQVERLHITAPISGRLTIEGWPSEQISITETRPAQPDEPNCAVQVKEVNNRLKVDVHSDIYETCSAKMDLTLKIPMHYSVVLITEAETVELKDIGGTVSGLVNGSVSNYSGSFNARSSEIEGDHFIVSDLQGNIVFEAIR